MMWIYIASGISLALVVVFWVWNKKNAAKLALEVADKIAKATTTTDADDIVVDILRDIIDKDK